MASDELGGDGGGHCHKIRQIPSVMRFHLPEELKTVFENFMWCAVDDRQLEIKCVEFVEQFELFASVDEGEIRESYSASSCSNSATIV
jgi:hypothetical protein